MRLVQGLLIIAAVFAALAYSFNKKSVSAGELAEADIVNPAQMSLVENLDAAPDARLEVMRASVHGDVLHAFVQYSSCADLEFELVGSRNFAESFPIQAQVVIRAVGADSGSDCDVLRSRDLRFNLANLRKTYHNLYNMSSGTILIQLNDYPTLIRYDF